MKIIILFHNRWILPQTLQILMFLFTFIARVWIAHSKLPTVQFHQLMLCTILWKLPICLWYRIYTNSSTVQDNTPKNFFFEKTMENLGNFFSKVRKRGLASSWYFRHLTKLLGKIGLKTWIGMLQTKWNGEVNKMITDLHQTNKWAMVLIKF